MTNNNSPEKNTHGRSLLAKKPGDFSLKKPKSEEGKTRSFVPPAKSDTTDNDKVISGLESRIAEQSLAHAAKVAELEERLIAAGENVILIDGEVVAALDPKNVVQGPFANRIDIAYEDDDFGSLYSEIKAQGRNEIPGKVRPTGNNRYEVVYGHRRHQACLKAGVPFHALVEELSDREMLEKMTTENEDRKDLSPFEDALRYRNWVDEQEVWPSYAELGRALGRSQPYISQRTSILSLPQEVFIALGDPRAISITDWRQLVSVNNKDGEELLTIAKDIAGDRSAFSVSTEEDVKKVFRVLIRLNSGTPNSEKIKSETHKTTSGRNVFSHRKANGKLQITLDKTLPEELQAQVIATLETFFQENLG